MKFTSYYMVENSPDLINSLAKKVANKLKVNYKGLQDVGNFKDVDLNKYKDNPRLLQKIELYKTNYVLMFNDNPKFTDSAFVVLTPIDDNVSYNDLYNKTKKEFDRKRKEFGIVDEDSPLSKKLIQDLPNGDLEVFNLQSWDDSLIEKIGYILRKLGYDIRGNEDVRNNLEMIVTSFHKIPKRLQDYIFAIKTVFSKSGIVTEEIDVLIDSKRKK